MPALKNAKHERFAQAIAAGKQDVEAYTGAGFKCSEEAAAASASRLKKDKTVAARIAEINGAAAERTTISIVRAVEELAKLGFANVQRFGDLGFTGDVSTLDEADAAALRSVTVEHFTDGKGKDAREVKRVKFEIHDKRGPLVDIIRQLGGFQTCKAAGAGGQDEDANAPREDLDPLEVARRIAFALELGRREMIKRAAKAEAKAPAKATKIPKKGK